MSKRAYRATRVNDVNWDQLAQGKDGLDIALGVDVGEHSEKVGRVEMAGLLTRPTAFLTISTSSNHPD